MNVAVALQAIVSLLWVFVVGLIVLAVVRAVRGQPAKRFFTPILGLILAALILTSVSMGLVFVQPEERAVVISAVTPKGYRDQPLQPGLNWIVPGLENAVIYKISRETYTMSKSSGEGQVQGDDSIAARTADGQEVSVDASVIYSIDPAKVVTLHIEWQGRYTAELVRPLARGIIRDAISQYGVEQVYSSKRSELTQQIHDTMAGKLAENGLTLEDFILRDIGFSPEYAASVEQKQIAEQQAQQAKFVVEQRKQEAEQARQVAQGAADASVIKAEGDAKARLIQAQAEAQALEQIATAVANSPSLLSYLYINKINPGVQVMMLPNNQNFLFPLPTLGPPSSLAPSDSPTPAPTPTPLPTQIPLPTPLPTATP
jgi:regulator of protease activity HflC (stomatin/prohibitin superfamily)